ncbi:MAG: MFS transporter [Caldilineaceae bacterium]
MTTAPVRRDPYAAFRYPAYRYFILGWLLSLMGSRIQAVAVAWEIYSRTGDAMALGFVGLAQALPTMVFALFAGYIADRYPRPRVLMMGETLRGIAALTMLLLSVTKSPVQWMYLPLALDATANILGRPARASLISRLVPTETLANAVTWNTSMVQIASVVGPAVGGMALLLGAPVAFAINVLTALSFVAIVYWLKLPGQANPNAHFTLQTLLGGIRYVWNVRILLVLMALDLFAVLLGGAVYLLPIYAKDIFKVGETGFGWLQAAPAVGALIMAFTLPYLPPLRHAGRTMVLTVAGFGIATIIFGLTSNFWVALVMLALTGAFDNVSMVIRGTVEQLRTADEMRGRVSAVNGVFIGASNQLGGFESGLVADLFSPVVSVVSGGIGTLVVVTLAWILSPQLRELKSLDDGKQ